MANQTLPLQVEVGVESSTFKGGLISVSQVDLKRIWYLLIFGICFNIEIDICMMIRDLCQIIIKI